MINADALIILLATILLTFCIEEGVDALGRMHKKKAEEEETR